MKIFRILACAWALAFLAAGIAHAKIEKISFVKNGAYVQKVDTYILGDNAYIDAKEMAGLFNGKIYWYQISGKLFFQIKGNRVVFYKDKDDIVINDEKVSFPNSYIVRGGRPFILKDFFVSKDFSSAFGFKLDYNEKTRVLEEKHDVNINSVNYFSYKDRTRVVIYMSEDLKYQTSQKENNLLRLNILGGMAYANEKININDGVVKFFEIIQENKYARVGILLDENFENHRIFKLNSPDRIVIDLFSVYANDTRKNAGDVAPTTAVMAEIVPNVDAAASLSSGGNPGENGDEDKAAINIPDKIIVDKDSDKIVVLDPGHGGRDPGGRTLFGLKEKDINLRIAKLVYEKFKKADGVKVVMTRTKDVFVPLSERSRMANELKADLFVSIHANASRSKKYNGFEIYFMAENASDPWAAEVADYENAALKYEKDADDMNEVAILLHSLARNEYMNEGSKLAGFVAAQYERKTPFRSRGVKQAAFYVLRGTYAPGILVEAGFMTNVKDAKNLNRLNVRKKIADAIYEGVIDYFKSKGWK